MILKQDYISTKNKVAKISSKNLAKLVGSLSAPIYNMEGKSSYNVNFTFTFQLITSECPNDSDLQIIQILP